MTLYIDIMCGIHIYKRAGGGRLGGRGELKREWIVMEGTKEAYYIAEIAEICNMTKEG